jgi:hypothetical protein
MRRDGRTVLPESAGVVGRRVRRGIFGAGVLIGGISLAWRHAPNRPVGQRPELDDLLNQIDTVLATIRFDS